MGESYVRWERAFLAMRISAARAKAIQNQTAAKAHLLAIVGHF